MWSGRYSLLRPIKRHDAQLIDEQRITITHGMGRVQSFICQGVVRERYLLHADEHQREVGPKEEQRCLG